MDFPNPSKVDHTSLITCATSCNISPNSVTYVAIGCANNGLQEYPNFVSDFQKRGIHVNLILIDPVLESPLKFPESSMGLPNLTMHTLDTAIDYNDEDPDHTFFMTIIDKVIKVKKTTPESTCLLFVTDYSGHNLLSIGDGVRTKVFMNATREVQCIYDRNILFGLNPIENTGCFPDLASEIFQPIIIQTKTIGLKIYNSRYATDADMLVFLLGVTKYHVLKSHAIAYFEAILKRFGGLVNNFRQAVMCVTKHPALSIVPQIESVLIYGINYDKVEPFRGRNPQIMGVCYTMYQNLCSELNKQLSFLGLFCEANLEFFFGEFLEICRTSYVLNSNTDPYKYYDTYNKAKNKLIIFLCDLKKLHLMFSVEEHVEHLPDLKELIE